MANPLSTRFVLSGALIFGSLMAWSDDAKSAPSSCPTAPIAVKPGVPLTVAFAVPRGKPCVVTLTGITGTALTGGNQASILLDEVQAPNGSFLFASDLLTVVQEETTVVVCGLSGFPEHILSVPASCPGPEPQQTGVFELKDPIKGGAISLFALIGGFQIVATLRSDGDTAVSDTLNISVTSL